MRLILEALLLIALGSSALGQTDSIALVPNLEAEAWVRQRFKSGLVADLSQRFPPNKRVIGARLVTELATSAPATKETRRTGVAICGAIVSGSVDLSYAVTEQLLRFRDCQFLDTVSFVCASGRERISFLACRFNSSFLAPELKAEDGINLHGSRFGGAFDIRLLRANGFVCLDSITLDSAGGPFLASTIEVDGPFLMRHAVCRRAIDMPYVHVSKNLELRGSRFLDTAANSFISMQVDGHLLADQTEYCGYVDFGGTIVGGGFSVTHCTTVACSFSCVRCEGASFVDTQFKDRAEFIGLVSRSDVNFTNARFDEASMSQMIVGATLRFDHAKFGGPYSLSRCTYDRMSISGELPDNRDSCFERMISLLDNAYFSGEIYTTLESYFERYGYDNWADSAFVARQRRERTDLLSPLGTAYWWNQMMDWLVLYGRAPGRVLIWGLMLTAIGGAVFREDLGMKPQNRGHIKTPKFNRYWYSIDALLPFVDLRMECDWQPTVERHLAWAYLRIHKLMGWILTIVLVAAVTGFLGE